MHRALYIEDIVRDVAAYVDCREDQLSMSLTCCQFFDPAMDRLWHTVKSMQRLVHCLPQELLEDTPVEGRWFTKLVALPSEHQWDRFRQYAHRVRKIWLHDVYSSLVPEESIGVYDVIRKHHPYPEYCLFPRLYKFSCSSSCIAIIHHLDVLVQPSLRKFFLGIYYDDTSLALLDLIAARCPKIEVPELVVWSRTPLYLSALTRALYSWKHLTEFSFHKPIEEEALRHISRLPCLKKLNIQMLASPCAPFPESDPWKPLFPSLRTMRITCIHMDDPRLFLDWLRSIRPPPRLRKIFIEGPCPPSARGLVRKLFAILATYTTMKDVSVIFDGDDELSPPKSDYLTAEEVLLPLILNLPHVRTLHLYHIPLDWTPAFLERLASAWPMLVHLDLYDCAVPTRMCKVQVSDLLPLAQFCPALRFLVIQVSPHMPETPLGARNYKGHDVEINHRLKDLRLADSIFEPASIPRVAVFLDTFFPSAKLHHRPHTSTSSFYSVELYSQMEENAAQINQLRKPKIRALRAS